MADNAKVQLSDEAMKHRWTLGWHDRGLGYGDYGILVDGKLLIGDIACGMLAEHIKNLHNEWLENLLEAQP